MPGRLAHLHPTPTQPPASLRLPSGAPGNRTGGPQAHGGAHRQLHHRDLLGRGKAGEAGGRPCRPPPLVWAPGAQRRGPGSRTETTRPRQSAIRPWDRRGLLWSAGAVPRRMCHAHGGGGTSTGDWAAAGPHWDGDCQAQTPSAGPVQGPFLVSVRGPECCGAEGDGAGGDGLGGCALQGLLLWMFTAGRHTVHDSGLWRGGGGGVAGVYCCVFWGFSLPELKCRASVCGCVGVWGCGGGDGGVWVCGSVGVWVWGWGWGCVGVWECRDVGVGVGMGVWGCGCVGLWGCGGGGACTCGGGDGCRCGGVGVWVRGCGGVWV